MKNPTLAKLALLLLIMLMACDDTLPSRAKISFWNYGNHFITTNMLDVRVSEDGHGRHLAGNAFYPDQSRYLTVEYPTFHTTDYFSTPTDGDITTFVKLMDGDITVAEGAITDQLIEDYSLSIIIVISAVRPDYGWIGTGRYVGFPINSAYIDSTILDEADSTSFYWNVSEDGVLRFDSLYIMLAGNWITNPVIY